MLSRPTVAHLSSVQVLIADIRAVLTHCQFASNPARIMLGSQQVSLLVYATCQAASCRCGEPQHSHLARLQLAAVAFQHGCIFLKSHRN